MKRIDQVGGWLEQNDIDLAVITSTPNVFYLSHFYSDPHERLLALLVFPRSEPILVLPGMEVESARQQGFHCEMIGYSDTENPWELIKQRLDARQITPKRIAVEKQHLNLERSEQIHALYPDAAFVSAEEKLQALRLIKDEQEIKILKEAAKLADYGVEVGVNAIKEGKTELEILAEVEFELKKKGVNQMSFATMVLAGSQTAAPHGVPGLNKVKKGDFVLFDLGVVLDGYCSDITRTVAFGDIGGKQRHIYETVLKAQEAALHACKPGVEIGSIDRTARDIIREAGYGDYFTHRIGHGLGIDVHEVPSMNETNRHPLQTGMVFTIEPGIYVPAVGGVRIEDDVLITKDGFESLTNYPKELQIIR